MQIPKIHTINLLMLFFCFFILCTSAFLQFNMHVQPCILCLLQRWFFLFILVLMLFPCLYELHATPRLCYHLLVALVCFSGLGLAARQIWLQHLPAGTAPSCGADMNFLITHFGWLDSLKLILQGSDDCAKIDFTLLGYSLAHWSASAFGLLSLLNIYQAFRHESGYKA